MTDISKLMFSQRAALDVAGVPTESPDGAPVSDGWRAKWAAEELVRLRAALAEAEATLANERGEGEPPEPGWVFKRGETLEGDAWVNRERRMQVWRAHNARGWGFGVEVRPGRHEGPAGQDDNQPARAAMRAASERLRGSP